MLQSYKMRKLDPAYHEKFRALVYYLLRMLGAPAVHVERVWQFQQLSEKTVIRVQEHVNWMVDSEGNWCDYTTATHHYRAALLAWEKAHGKHRDTNRLSVLRPKLTLATPKKGYCRWRRRRRKRGVLSLLPPLKALKETGIALLYIIITMAVMGLMAACSSLSPLECA